MSRIYTGELFRVVAELHPRGVLNRARYRAVLLVGDANQVVHQLARWLPSAVSGNDRSNPTRTSDRRDAPSSLTRSPSTCTSKVSGSACRDVTTSRSTAVHPATVASRYSTNDNKSFLAAGCDAGVIRIDGAVCRSFYAAKVIGILHSALTYGLELKRGGSECIRHCSPEAW